MRTSCLSNPPRDEDRASEGGVVLERTKVMHLGLMEAEEQRGAEKAEQKVLERSDPDWSTPAPRPGGREEGGDAAETK